jgi:hypothetical protein
VAEQHADAHVLLAAFAELWPVVDHRRAEIKVAPGDEHVRAERGGAFRARPDHADRVSLPGPAGRGIGDAAPEVDDRLSLDRDAGRGAHLPPFHQVALELLPHGREARVTGSFDAHVPPSG